MHPLWIKERTVIMSMKKSHTLWVVILIAFLPMILLRDMTPDNELRYIHIAESALRSGNLFAFTLNGEPYADKPPLYIWLIILCRLISGKYLVWELSLLSFIPAVIITQTMEKWMGPELTDKERITGRLMLMSSVYFIAASIVARMDMLMSMFIILALYIFWKRYQHQDTDKDRWLFPIYLFLAVFTKGPLGLLIPLVSTIGFLVYKHQGKQFFHYWDLRTWMFLMIGCAIWFTASYQEGGSAYLYDLLLHQTFGRAFHAFHHEQPFYFYLISIWYELAPWSLLVMVIIVECIRRHFQLSDLQKFMLCTVVLSFLLLSMISAKLPIYLLPTFPFAIFLTVSLISRFVNRKWMRICIGIPAALLCLVFPTIALGYTLLAFPILSNGLIWMAAACFSLSGVGTLYQLHHHSSFTEPLRTLAVGMFLALFFIGCAMPALNPLLS